MQFPKEREKILIIDFGSEVTKLIGRNIRELGVYSEILTIKEFKKVKEFHLIKGSKNDEYTLYASHSKWSSEESFIEWTKSESFRNSHKNANKHKGIYIGHPNFEGFTVII